MEHIPVLLEPVLAMFSEGRRPLKRFLDGTFGRGGHTRAILQRFPAAEAVGLDRDEDAIVFADEKFHGEIADGKLKMVRANYTEGAALNLGFFDGILLDLGVSSPQLDVAERGFSFQNDGPLDMRMDRREGTTAADLVNHLDEEELGNLFRELGEIPRPMRVVNAIVKDRKTAPFETTRQFATLVERVEGWQRRGHHPATRYFMALRLKVNHELEDVESGVKTMMDLLEPGGRLQVITFHSLEDRIVKNLFRGSPEKGEPVQKKVIKPTWDEQKKNPRSRSAKLRGFERNDP